MKPWNSEPRLQPAPTITAGGLPSRVYQEWEELLISNLLDSSKLEPLRVQMAAAARRRFAWETVAGEWSAEFTRVLAGYDR